MPQLSAPPHDTTSHAAHQPASFFTGTETERQPSHTQRASLPPPHPPTHDHTTHHSPPHHTTPHAVAQTHANEERAKGTRSTLPADATHRHWRQTSCDYVAPGKGPQDQPGRVAAAEARSLHGDAEAVDYWGGDWETRMDEANRVNSEWIDPRAGPAAVDAVEA